MSTIIGHQKKTSGTSPSGRPGSELGENFLKSSHRTVSPLSSSLTQYSGSISAEYACLACGLTQDRMSPFLVPTSKITFPLA